MKLSQETITVIGSAIGITGIIITAMFFFFDNINDKIDESDSRLTGQIQALDIRLTGQLQAQDSRIAGQIQELDSRLTSQIQELDSRLTSQIQALDSRLTSEIQMLRQENKAIRADIQTLSDDVAILKGKVETVLQLRVSSNDKTGANGLPDQSVAAGQ